MRARCLAFFVASPRLLEVDAKTIPHMRLANALCRFVEVAELQTAGAPLLSSREAHGIELYRSSP
jgi:hypothetical protein